MNTRAAKLLCLIFATLRLCGNRLSFVMKQQVINARRLSLLSIIVSSSLGGTALAQERQPVSVQPDSPRWKLEGEAKPAEYLGRKSLYLNGGGATLRNDVVYIPLKKGRNESMLAVSELGGGWGFICRVAELESQ